MRSNDCERGDIIFTAHKGKIRGVMKREQSLHERRCNISLYGYQQYSESFSTPSDYKLFDVMARKNQQSLQQQCIKIFY